METTLNKLLAMLLAIALGTAATPGAAGNPARVTAVANPPAMQVLEAHRPGRSLPGPGGDTYQWPGLYFEARFEGQSVYFKVGAGEVILRVRVDDAAVATLEKPAPGTYEVAGLSKQPHSVRIEALTESQAGANVFGGFFYAKPTRPLPPMGRPKQIEFIGDSHTVGYGNTSTTRDCNSEAVWKTTDNSQAFGARMARHYDADYQVNAISGRGIVRNYGGGAGDPLPDAYPFVLLDHSTRYVDAAWRPQVMVIALGTNDFTTALKPGEKWKSREELHADYEATYLRFLEGLRARNPAAFMIVWATEMAEGEIASEAGKVVARLQSAGDQRITFVPVNGLAMTGCDWHPSVADDETIATTLMRVIDRSPTAWGARAP
jgi:lysophospholipase L1-like esterase